MAASDLKSPLRYPGGKTWLVPIFRAWLDTVPKPTILVEPFAGGASVSLACLREDWVNRCLWLEMDSDVSAFWKAALYPAAACLLAERIVSYELGTALPDSSNPVERAFQVLLRNRTQFGGILAPGAGCLKRGEKDHGPFSRWYPQTLARRVKAIREVSPRVSFMQNDALRWLDQPAHRFSPGWTLFVDPPYPVIGKRLYPHWDVDHARLFALCAAFPGPCLMTYAPAAEIEALAHKHRMHIRPVSMLGNALRKRQEWCITKNSW